MSFIESYKRLDNLCKDLFKSEAGVSSYINSMEQQMYSCFQVANWESDYKKLKQYRYMRNQIAHENNVSESNSCDESDRQWIEQFHQRILDRTDPLALYQKAVTVAKQKAYKFPKIGKNSQPVIYKPKSTTTIWQRIASFFFGNN